MPFSYPECWGGRQAKEDLLRARGVALAYFRYNNFGELISRIFSTTPLLPCMVVDDPAAESRNLAADHLQVRR